MSTITWVTKKGDLGTIPESQFFSLQFEATDSGGESITYSFISGILPGSMYVTRSGELRGAPTIVDSVDQLKTYSFTVRATNTSGNVADRSFSITVSNVVGPTITPRPDLIGAFFDGEFLSYQFGATNDNSSAKTSWSLIRGDLPPGTTLSSSGLLSGYVDLIAANITNLGFEAGAWESIIFDPLPESTDKYYNFTVQVTDGAKYDTVNVRVLIVSKANFTADNDITVVNNTFITIDHDNSYRPIILNGPDTLPTRLVGDTFAYKFLAYDPEDAIIQWQVDELLFSGLDELDYPANDSINGDGTTGPYTLSRTTTTDDVSVRVNGKAYYATVDYTVSGSNLTFTSLTPTALDVIEVLFITPATGFDSLLWDQGAEGLPSGLQIDRDTGWLFGTLPEQVEDIKTYPLRVLAYRKLSPGVLSDPVVFNLNVKRTRNEEIIWTTPTDLGSIDNGSVSEIAIRAYNTLGKELDYSLTYQPYRKIPQGLQLLTNGDFIGRVTFRYFSLDGQTGWLPLTSTAGLEVGMNVQGVGVAAGCEITQIVSSTMVEVQPAIYVVQGTPLTFSNDSSTVVVSTSANAISTVIDGGDTTFDQDCRFTVKATARDASISSTKSFKVHIKPRNLAPYENLYLKALPSSSQRVSYENLMTNENLVPTSLIYRPKDPNFGIQKNIKFLFLPGLSVATASDIVNAMQYNHYFKSLNFGDIKTARAVDDNGTVKYEVVYAEVIDHQMFAGNSPPLSTTLSNTNKFLYNGAEYGNTIYTNSFFNMQRRIESGIGYTNRGAMPDWMLSVQENGRVLGLTRAVVLAYTKPNSSKLIAYRLQNSGFNLNAVQFNLDRYQWDNVLSKFFDPATNRFLPSRDTTFDKYPNLGVGSDVITASVIGSVTDSNTVITSDNLKVGYGWVFTGIDTGTEIAANTFVTSVTGTTVSGSPALNITLSSNITATNGSTVKFDGRAFVDYAVDDSFNRIDSELLSRIKSLGFIDGVSNVQPFEKIIFSKQFGFDYESVNDGWIRGDGTEIYGYLDKESGLSPRNERGGIWQITFKTIPDLGFDDDSVGFDEASAGFYHSRLDQGSDQEVRLEFVSEVNINQTVKIRGGKTFPASTLQYRFSTGESTPQYRIFTGSIISEETTFDGASCQCREGDPGEGGIRGGTAFSNNRDKYTKPEAEDKYIKFPQNGVFV